MRTSLLLLIQRASSLWFLPLSDDWNIFSPSHSITRYRLPDGSESPLFFVCVSNVLVPVMT